MILGFLIFGCLAIEGLEAPDKENSGWVSNGSLQSADGCW